MRSNEQGAPVETVRGEVEDVRVLREGWGRMRVGGESITGPVMGFAVGDQIEARGRWTDDPKWGRQFKAQTIRCTLASDARGVITWLSSRLPGLGKKRATELLERYGTPERLYDAIANRHEELCSVRGITPKLAEQIRDEHARVRGESEEMTQLLGWGLTDGQIRKAREVWGKKVIATLREDPYRLAEEVHGFGFQRADLIARRMGLPIDHPRRIEACLVHLLREAEGMGHCYVPRAHLMRAAVQDLAGVGGGRIAGGLNAIVEAGRVIDEDGRVYLPSTHAAELEVAAMVSRLGGVAA